MRTKQWIVLAVVLTALGLLMILVVRAGPPAQEPGPQGSVVRQAGVGTAFTYQGRLESGGKPVNESCDMVFRLYDAESGGSQVGSAISTTVPVIGGLFTVGLDFGSGVFAGNARWLGIAVKCPADVAYADLGRQALTAAPYALYATRAMTATQAVSAAFASDADTLDGLHASAFVTSSHTHLGSDITGPVTEAISATWAITATYALGSGDADTLDGLHASAFVTSSHTHLGSDITGPVTEAISATWAITATYALGSGDADTLDGLHASAFVTSSHTHLGSDITGPVTEAISATWATTATYALGSGDADTLDGLHGDAFWQVGGNAGTTPGMDYLGTSDGVTLTLAVSGTAALRLVPDATSPNVIGGHSANSVGVAAHGATIGGGGDDTSPNRVMDYYDTIGGGYGNTASGSYATVSGGRGNIAIHSSTVGGGAGNTADLGFTTIGGGSSNTAEGPGSTVGGGYLNTASGLGGATVGGGWYNTATGDRDTVGGGGGNTARGGFATVGGGQFNTASGDNATVGGGGYNTASGMFATVSGGWENAASGYASAVVGGQYNTASGHYSFAAGRRAKAVHQGAFVWADSTDVDYTSTITDQFAVRASNGVSLSVDAGGSKAIAVGERYRDNAIIAWARVSATGSITTGSVYNTFGIESVAKIGTGQYAITITARTASADLLIPMAVAEIAPPPSGKGAVRIVSVSQTGPRTFEVYINDGTFALVDNDFVFMVTGR